ncbi:MAG: hypothetical protein JNM52_08695, partial [Betaproteobacteria bacterium]|nr:hypothetical protein [Betaproteobacteria bacterium]
WQSVSMPVMPSWADLHAALKGRLKLEARPYEPIQHRALELLYPQGYEVFEQAGVLHGSAQDGEGPIALLGVINRKLMGANVAWGLADRIYAMVSKPPQRLHVLVDCEGHSTALDDERVMLSSYLVNVALALGELAQGGTQIETTVLGKVGGGVYVALAAVAKVNVLYGAEVQTLPSKAIASILGEAKLSQPEFAEHVKARVAESELKIGLV